MEKIDIAVRCFVDNIEKNDTEKEGIDKLFNKNLIFVFDTETTIDTFQNLMFGTCGIWKNGKLMNTLLFYADDLKKKDLDTLKEYEYLEKNNVTLLTKSEFINLFYTNVYKSRAICVGFNLPFDISRIAIHCRSSKSYKNAFSFVLSDNKNKPRILIKHRNSKSSWIGFGSVISGNRRKAKVAGAFLDLRTLTFALTNEAHTLESACKLFDTPHKKQKTDDYGKVTLKHISYGINDIWATYDLYVKLIENYKSYNLSVPVNSLCSPASLGKAYFDAMNVKSFVNRNPDFSKEMLGYVMSTYFGGRTEVHIRKQPVKVTYLDFTSMYPTIFELLRMWRFLIADKIEYKEDNEFQARLDSITAKDMLNKETWKDSIGIALVEPDEDILPIRSKFGNKIVHNIGINYVSDKQVWYTYLDIIASKVLTGKSAKVIKSYKFEPIGIQKDLKPITLFGKTIDPSKQDFIKELIEHRIMVNKQLKTDHDNKSLDTEQKIAKVIASSISYGVYVEINTIPEEIIADVYGIKHFKIEVDKKETLGRAFNPIVATSLTAGARLILAMTEAFVEQNKGYYAYCDTDSMFISPELVDKVKEYFKPLNPYDVEVDMFKIEKKKEKGKEDIPLHDIWCYAISAKRYCLYTYNNGKIEILKYSSHGIGNIQGMYDGWEEDFWKDVLFYHYGKITKEDIVSKYGSSVVATKFSVISPTLMKRFNKINSNSANGGIKGFNFITVGVGYRKDEATGEPIIPVVPFTKDHKIIKHMPFYDYKTGKYYEKDTEYYWKPLSKLFFDYINHKEEKYDGDIGTLKRKHLIIDNISHMGKESNNLEESEVVGVSEDDYVIYDDQKEGSQNNANKEDKIRDIIRKLTLKEAKRRKISKSEYYYLKTKGKSNEPLTFKKKTLRKLLQIN
jgi:hypothetical protein